ncbi:MAG: hypothetical protein K2Y28_09665 [Burkholderiaceae bacterium]|nr:hypothetical protein [Burkholderiaceae bacterium]
MENQPLCSEQNAPRVEDFGAIIRFKYVKQMTVDGVLKSEKMWRTTRSEAR